MTHYTANTMLCALDAVGIMAIALAVSLAITIGLLVFVIVLCASKRARRAVFRDAPTLPTDKKQKRKTERPTHEPAPTDAQSHVLEEVITVPLGSKTRGKKSVAPDDDQEIPAMTVASNAAADYDPSGNVPTIDLSGVTRTTPRHAAPPRTIPRTGGDRRVPPPTRSAPHGRPVTGERRPVTGERRTVTGTRPRPVDRTHDRKR